VLLLTMRGHKRVFGGNLKVWEGWVIGEGGGFAYLTLLLFC
jgi:hypothetical protein